jgi:hypothetical protein
MMAVVGDHDAAIGMEHRAQWRGGTWVVCATSSCAKRLCHRRSFMERVARQLASAMANGPDISLVGFLDDEDRLQGRALNGLLIHSLSDLAEVLNSSAITYNLLALPSVLRQRRNDIPLKPHKVAVRTLHGLTTSLPAR